MLRKKSLIPLLLILIVPLLVGWIPLSRPFSQQDSAPRLITAYRLATAFAGPGHTYLQAGMLNPGVPVQIVERNHTGNWLHIRGEREDGSAFIDGWVMTGYLNVDATLRFSEVPVNTTLADADTDYVEGDSLARLYRAPVIPAISAAMREVVVLGKSLGNRAGVVTKIGDSLSANPNYLTLISRGDHDLGPYDYLEDTVNFFGPSLAEGSVASRGGLTTYVVFDPLWADDDLCNANESPLDCELRRKQPSIATILFGQNDVRHMTDGEFEVQMRQLVEETLAWGVIPVLTTFSANPDEELYWQSINFNLALMDIAAEYEVPLINLWSAARPLPNYGLDIDSVHLTNSGFASLKYSTGHESWYGVSLLNLLTLRTLDEIRRTLEME